MSRADNKALAGRLYSEFWSDRFNPDVVDDLAAPDTWFPRLAVQPLKSGAGGGIALIQMSDRLVGALAVKTRAQEWLADARRVDQAVYAAIAATPTPALDQGMSQLSHAANKSRLWISVAAVLSVAGGRPGRRAALQGLASVAVSSAVVNLGVKQVAGRRRPDREGALVPTIRHVPMPTSLSFPSGHSASAFAFATGVGNRLPPVAVPLHGLAGVVAYSRVHTGVHYPGDVVVGALLGTVLAQLTTRAMDRYVGRRG